MSEVEKPWPWETPPIQMADGLLIHAQKRVEEMDHAPDALADEISAARDALKHVASTLQSQARRVEELEGALRKAEGWFRDYERQHRAKRTSEGNLKADTNQERADFLGSVLSEGEKGS